MDRKVKINMINLSRKKKQTNKYYLFGNENWGVQKN